MVVCCCRTWLVSSGAAIVDGFSSVAAGYGAASKALELQELQASTETKKDDKDKDHAGASNKQGQTKPPLSFGPGPNATEQDIQKFRDTTKDMSVQLLNLFWLLVKFDINNTLSSEFRPLTDDVSRHFPCNISCLVWQVCARRLCGTTPCPSQRKCGASRACYWWAASS
jgi:hypothetical protein